MEKFNKLNPRFNNAGIDDNRNASLIVLNTVGNTPLAVSGFSLSGIGAIAMAIVDASGNQITSFGGGTQYTDGGTPPTHPIGNTIIFDNGGTWQHISVANPLPVSATFSPSGTQDTNLKQVGGSSFALGQQLAAASLPVVLTASQIATLTPPSNTGYALDSSLTTIDSDLKSNITLHAGSNIIGKVGIDQTTPGTTNAISLAQIGSTTVATGNGIAGAGVQRVTIASDNTAFSVNATLSAETTKVIGTVNVSSGQTIGLAAGSQVIGHVIVDSGTITTVSAVTSITNTVNTAEVAPTTISNGKTTVTTSGTRVTLASSTAVKSVTIKALSTNTGIIYVGNSSVASTNGFQLQAGETVSMDIANLNTVNLDSSVSGEGVTYIAVS